MINPKPDDSYLNSAAEVASYALGTIRRFMKNGEMLTKDDLVLLHDLADAAHNIPQMLSPSESDVWTLESLQEDVLRCKTLMSKLNSRSYISTEKRLFAKESNSSLKPFLQKLLDRALQKKKPIIARDPLGEGDTMKKSIESHELSDKVTEKINQTLQGNKL
jgi:hypothetical protein